MVVVVLWWWSVVVVRGCGPWWWSVVAVVVGRGGGGGAGATIHRPCKKLKDTVEGFGVSQGSGQSPTQNTLTPKTLRVSDLGLV